MEDVNNFTEEERLVFRVVGPPLFLNSNFFLFADTYVDNTGKTRYEYFDTSWSVSEVKKTVPFNEALEMLPKCEDLIRKASKQRIITHRLVIVVSIIATLLYWLGTGYAMKQNIIAGISIFLIWFLLTWAVLFVVFELIPYVLFLVLFFIPTKRRRANKMLSVIYSSFDDFSESEKIQVKNEIENKYKLTATVLGMFQESADRLGLVHKLSDSRRFTHKIRNIFW